MKISIDTKEDSHDEIKKVIKMLHNLVGDSQEVFINQPAEQSQSTENTFTNILGDISNTAQEQSSAEQAAQATENAFTNILGDISNTAQEQSSAEQAAQATKGAQAEETTQSTEDLFAELFSEEELKKMEATPAKEEEEHEEELPKAKSKKYNIEFY